MSKSRGTFITAESYLEPGPEPRVAALLLRRQAERHDGGHRPQPRRLRRAGQLGPDRQVREHREPVRRASSTKRFDGKLAAPCFSPSWELIRLRSSSFSGTRPTISQTTTKHASLAKALREIMQLADLANQYVDQNKPWELAKEQARARRATAQRVLAALASLPRTSRST